MKKFTVLVLLAIIVSMCSTAMALDPMGAPSAGLTQGQKSSGIEYSYSKQKLWRSVDEETTSMEQEINKVYARFGYGISDKTEGFVRVGVADYEYERAGYYAPWKGDDDTALAIGVGIKTTFAEADGIRWGGLAQVSRANYKGSRKNSDSSSSWQTGSFETEVVEFLLTAGPTFNPTEDVSVYCGPFIHLIDGDHFHSHGGGSRKYEVEERSSVGAYVGAQIELAENRAVTVEYQRTNDAWGFAGGIVIRH